jgi:hypothetical protein
MYQLEVTKPDGTVKDLNVLYWMELWIESWGIGKILSVINRVLLNGAGPFVNKNKEYPCERLTLIMFQTINQGNLIILLIMVQTFKKK